VHRYLRSLPNYKNVELPSNPIQVLSLEDTCGFLPMHYAVASHNEVLFNKLVEILLTFPNGRYYFNSPDRVGNSPVHWAIMKLNYRAVVTLAQCGADISLMNHDGKSPLHLLVAQCKSKSAEELALHHKMVKFLIATGAQVDAYDLNNVTPLHIAAEVGDKELVEFLILEGGAFVNSIDDVGETPLFYALRGQHSEVVKRLVELKANLFARNLVGESPLEYCVSVQDEHMGKLLSQLVDSSEELSFNSNLTSSPAIPIVPTSSGYSSSGSGIYESGMSMSDISFSSSSEFSFSGMEMDLSRSGEFAHSKADMKDAPRMRTNSRDAIRGVFNIGVF